MIVLIIEQIIEITELRVLNSSIKFNRGVLYFDEQ
jgi:hypothetical protein